MLGQRFTGVLAACAAGPAAPPKVALGKNSNLYYLLSVSSRQLSAALLNWSLFSVQCSRCSLARPQAAAAAPVKYLQNNIIYRKSSRYLLCTARHCLDSGPQYK